MSRKLAQMKAVLDTARKGLGDDVVVSASLRVPQRDSRYAVVRSMETDMQIEHQVLMDRMADEIQRVIRRGRGVEKSELLLVAFDSEDELRKAESLSVDDLWTLVKAEGGYSFVEAKPHKYLEKKPTGKIDPKTGKPQYIYIYQLPSGRRVSSQDPLHPSHVPGEDENDPQHFVPFGQVEQHPAFGEEELEQLLLRGSLQPAPVEEKTWYQTKEYKDFIRPLVEKYIGKHFEDLYGADDELTPDEMRQFTEGMVWMSDLFRAHGVSVEDALQNEDLLHDIAGRMAKKGDEEVVFENLQEYAELMHDVLNDPGLHREFKEEQAKSGNAALALAKSNAKVIGGTSKYNGLKQELLEGDPTDASFKFIGTCRDLGLFRLKGGRIVYDQERASMFGRNLSELSEDQLMALALSRAVFDEDRSEHSFRNYDGTLRNHELLYGEDELARLDLSAQSIERLNLVGEEAAKRLDQYTDLEDTETLGPLVRPATLDGSLSLLDIMSKKRLASERRDAALGLDEFKRSARAAKHDTSPITSSPRLAKKIYNAREDSWTDAKDMPLSSFQNRLIHWAKVVKRGFNALGAGGGKTRAKIELIAGLVDEGQIHGGCIYTSPSVIPAWQEEIKKWHPDAKIKIIAGETGAERKKLLREAKAEGSEFVLCSMGALRDKVPKEDENYDEDLDSDAASVFGTSDTIDEEEFNLLHSLGNHAHIFDESHKLGLKNPDSNTHKRVKKLLDGKEYAYFMSATPITNTPGDVYHQLSLLQPNRLGDTEKQFERRFKGKEKVGDMEVETWNDLSKLNEVIDPYLYMLHRNDPDFQEYLGIPEPTVQYQSVGMHPKHFAYYHSIDSISRPKKYVGSGQSKQQVEGTGYDFDAVSEWVTNMAERPESHGKAWKLPDVESKAYAMNMAAAATRLKQELAISPKLIDPKYDGPQPVIDTSADNVIEHFNRKDGTPYVVAAMNIRALELHKEELIKRGISENQIAVYTGQTKNKKEMIDAFNEGKIRVLLLGTVAGGAGLNLQKSYNLDVLDQSWSPADMDQLVGRVYRKGQKTKVNINFVTAKNAMMEVIGSQARSKIAAMNAVLLGDKSVEQYKHITQAQVGMTGAMAEVQDELTAWAGAQPVEWQEAAQLEVQRVQEMLRQRTLAHAPTEADKERKRKIDEGISKKWKGKIAEEATRSPFGTHPETGEENTFRDWVKLRHAEEKALKKVAEQSKKGGKVDAKKIAKEAAEAAGLRDRRAKKKPAAKKVTKKPAAKKVTKKPAATGEVKASEVHSTPFKVAKKARKKNPWEGNESQTGTFYEAYFDAIKHRNVKGEKHLKELMVGAAKGPLGLSAADAKSFVEDDYKKFARKLHRLGLLEF